MADMGVCGESQQHVTRIAVDRNWRALLKIGAQFGFEHYVELAINNGACNLHDGLYLGCKYGHINIVRMTLIAGAMNLHRSFLELCANGRINIAKLLIDKGVILHREYVEVALNHGQHKMARFIEIIGHANMWEGYDCPSMNDAEKAEYGHIYVGDILGQW